MTDNRLYPATRAGLQAKAEAEWAEHRNDAKRKIAKLLDVLTAPPPVVDPAAESTASGSMMRRSP